MNIRIETNGLVEVVMKMERFDESMNLPIARELREWGEEVMTAAKHVVPVDQGNLMNSGHVQSEGMQVTLGFGGPAAPYAEAVHENLNPGIHWKRPGSGPKYLENPWNEKLPELEGRLNQ